MSREAHPAGGAFRLERKAVRPLSSRRSLSQDTGVEPVVQKSNRNPLIIPAGRDPGVGRQAC